ncbi:hypothetical protein pneo_cds_109 [Pandoravirus neocaledonia]|uniref:Uncharacterized protein n=1 Tax=Pandoravirus neocaledonia TaxID=2107708 RepID=A0A2U7UBB7_9VIRU|nr:hypothetical protein pneo_cds_109 [Pandoravirus neocaledonia]AVK75716.1 hypothetical protein pneo_cds_109 [Pandoravirus neocaledonia]
MTPTKRYNACSSRRSTTSHHAMEVTQHTTHFIMCGSAGSCACMSLCSTLAMGQQQFLHCRTSYGLCLRFQTFCLKL